MREDHMNSSETKPLRVAILGLGYVGLPVAQQAVAAGFNVTGFDLSERAVNGLNGGSSHVDDISDSEVQAMILGGFSATSAPDNISGHDVYVICVPTPLSPGGGPDLSAVESAGRSVAHGLSSGALVILESTTYPGTTDTVLRPILETSGLTAGIDFALAFSPERIDPGNQKFTFVNTPKVVGGLTTACRDRAAEFYGRMVERVVLTRGLREAEMAKLLENTYRHVNIALVNEMARFCADLDIDLWDVIDAASTKPFGFQAFYPGPGVGGHCIPIDPNYLSHFVRTETGYSFRFVELAQEINDSMPAYVASRVQDKLNRDGKATNGAEILLLGVTYKANIADVRESPAIPVARALRRMGAKVSFHDPHVSEWNVDDLAVDRVADPLVAATESDCVVLLQPHTSYDIEALVACAPRFLDTRGVTEPGSAERL
jgi:UDP-N-acetyl-D-glucosamine dehydrogenase